MVKRDREAGNCICYRDAQKKPLTPQLLRNVFERFHPLSPSLKVKIKQYPLLQTVSKATVAHLRRSNSSDMSQTSRNKVWNLYYHHFPFFMLTGPEGVFLHLFIISFLSFVAYGLYSVIPSYVPFLISRSYYYLTGGDY